MSAGGSQDSQQLHGRGQRKSVNGLRRSRRRCSPRRGKELRQQHLHQTRTVKHLSGTQDIYIYTYIYIDRQEQFNVLQNVVDKSEEVTCLDIVQWLRDLDSNYLSGRRRGVPTDTSQDLQDILNHSRRRPDHLENVA